LSLNIEEEIIGARDRKPAAKMAMEHSGVIFFLMPNLQWIKGMDSLHG
jgi:hypothetical protein